MSDIHVTIGRTYSAEWKITQGDRVKEHNEESGTVPAEYYFEGEALEGKLTVLSEEGRLDVATQKDGNRSRSFTNDGDNALNMAVG